MIILKNGIKQDSDTLAHYPRISLDERGVNNEESLNNDSLLLIKTTDDLALLDQQGEDIAQYKAIIIDFPSFADGRGFSIARHLRHQLNYQGHIRAAGHVIPDQATFMTECMIDSVELDEILFNRHGAENWAHSYNLIKLTYQTDIKGPRQSIAKLRHSSYPKNS